MAFYLHKCPMCGNVEEYSYSITECNDDPNNPNNKIMCPDCLEELIPSYVNEGVEQTSEEVIAKILKNHDIIMRRCIGTTSFQFKH